MMPPLHSPTDPSASPRSGRRSFPAAPSTRAGLLPALALLLALGGCNDTSTGTEGVRSLVDVAVEAGEYDLFLGAAATTGFLPALQQGGPFTVLGISDEAFQRLPATVRSRILNNPSLLAPIVAHHLISGPRTANQLAAVASVLTLEGTPLPTRVENGVVQVGDARIVEADLEAWNGVFHGVDRVLFPQVILSLVERLQVDDDFQTLETLLEAAGLLDDFRFDGPFTVFAPTDAAFEDLSDEARLELLGNPELLTRVLLHHVVSGARLQASLLPLESLSTLADTSLDLTPSGTTVQVGGATLLRPDLRTTNGVIHGVDQLLLPPDVVLPGMPGAPSTAGADTRP